MITQPGELRLTIGGAVNPRTGVYIVRPADDELLRLLERGEYCNVLCSRQMGKTSLIKRACWLLMQKGYAFADIEIAGYLGTPTDADEWYQGLLHGIARRLKLPVEVRQWWKSSPAITPNQKLIQFFRDEVAAKSPGDKPVIIFIDEIDSTLELPYTDDFFVAIRAMYNDRASDPLYEKLSFCLVGVAAPNELIKDKKKTPYNIGKTIELRDFDAERDDLSRLSQMVGGDETLDEILKFTGGHPYLTTLVAEKFVEEGCRSPEDVASLINTTFASLDEALSDPHFSYIRDFIAKRAEDSLVTLKLYRQILAEKEPVKDQITPAHIALKLAGLVKRGPNGTLAVRNEIYRRLFTEDWAAGVAESETRDRVEREGWATAARINEETLRASLDDYRVAFSQYQSLLANPAYEKPRADELWAGFFERRALRAGQSGGRDEAILWRLEALAAARNETRACAVQSLIAPDYPNLQFSFRHPEATGQGYPWPANQIVAFSPDGKRIATAGLDGTARLWSAETGQAIGAPMRHENSVLAVAFSPDGRRVLTGSSDQTARLWNAETGQAIGAPMRHENSVLAVAFSPDGRRVLTGSSDQTARLWSAETGQAIGAPMRHENWVLAVAFSPDSRRVLTGSSDQTARLWSAETGQAIGAPMRHEQGVLAVAFSPDGRRVLTGSSDQTARLWSAETSQAIGAPMRHENSVLAVAFSPDGRRVLTGSSDQTARLWSAETGQAIGAPMRHENSVLAVAFSPDGRRVLTGSSDRTARLWSAETSQAIGAPMRHENSVLAVAFSPDGRRVLTGSSDQTARLWSAETGQAIGAPIRHENSVRAVAFSPDGRRVLTGSSDRTARLWSAETGQAIGAPMRHENWVLAVAFSPDGRRVLTGSSDRTARLWSAETGQAIGAPMRHENSVRAVAFSPDGRRVLTGSYDQTARLWSAETGQAIGAPMRHENWVRAVAFSPDGRRVLTGSDDRTARLWSAETGQAIGAPMRHENWVLAVAFSPDGRRVLTGSDDQTARLWSAETGQAIGAPMRHENSVRAVAFSPDGRRTVAFTQWWVHVAELDGDAWRPVISRLLPGAWRWNAQCHFPDDAGARIQAGLGVTGDSTQVVTMDFDHPGAEPLVGDPRALLDEWQRRLGLKINPAGEIVPLWQ